jgi:long-subunit fatty acid transport protein
MRDDVPKLGFTVFALLMYAVFLAGPATAGGLYLNEFMTNAQGAAGAGAGALAEDASTSSTIPPE